MLEQYMYSICNLQMTLNEPYQKCKFDQLSCKLGHICHRGSSASFKKIPIKVSFLRFVSQVNIDYGIVESLRQTILPTKQSASASEATNALTITSEHSEELDIGAHIAEHLCSTVCLKRITTSFPSTQPWITRWITDLSEGFLVLEFKHVISFRRSIYGSLSFLFPSTQGHQNERAGGR